jgi:hypothetical protein
MATRRFALLIANSNYSDPELNRLIAPADDAEELARVLENPDICNFQVRTFHDQPAEQMRREIERFFLRGKQRDDVLLLYFSGHGIKDLDGQLHFAAVDTELDHHQVLESSAISASFVHQLMSRSRSRWQLLLLDCCHSGAFKEGMLAKGNETAGAIEQLQGQGRVILTASNALQYSFEGDTVRGNGKRSIFTHALVEGLETGDADRDGDGRCSIDDVYSYVCERLKNEQQAQQPMKIEMVEGELFLGDNPKPKPTGLPEDLLQDLAHDRREIRLAAVRRLDMLLQGNHKGRACSAQLELIRLQKEDDSQAVREAARQCTERYEAARQAEAAERERIAREQAEAARQAEAAERERIAREQAEAARQAEAAERERIAREQAEAAQRAGEKVEATAGDRIGIIWPRAMTPREKRLLLYWFVALCVALVLNRTVGDWHRGALAATSAVARQRG